jgi:hypothetical protein
VSALAPFTGAALAVPLGGYPRLFLMPAAFSLLGTVLSLTTGTTGGSREPASR